jgi:hypothetical protein
LRVDGDERDHGDREARKPHVPKAHATIEAHLGPYGNPSVPAINLTLDD